MLLLSMPYILLLPMYTHNVVYAAAVNAIHSVAVNVYTKCYVCCSVNAIHSVLSMYTHNVMHAAVNVMHSVAVNIYS